jgi:leucyl aminopeptidase (aminopeptidase T)
MIAPSFVKSVVNTCLRIGKEDRVCIFTWRHTLDLAEALAFECQKTGAKTHLEVETDELYYQNILSLPVEYLKETNPFSLALLDVATANIFISGPEDPEKLKQITPERMSVIVEADKPYYNKFLEKRIRSAEISLGYVTSQRAKTYGFDYTKWKENIQVAMNVDYEYMRDLGKKIGEMLEKASEITVRAANGTDLTLSLENRVARVNDGVVDDRDIEKGAVFTALPAGNVAVVPKERSARGIFIADVPEADSGVLIRDISWNFKEGKLVSFSGGQNIGVIKNRWEKAEGDKDQASWLMIGLNPKAQKGYLYNYIVLGSITLGVGDNRELGGKIETDFGSHCTVTEPTVNLDGKLIIKKGKFVF